MIFSSYAEIHLLSSFYAYTMPSPSWNLNFTTFTALTYLTLLLPLLPFRSSGPTISSSLFADGCFLWSCFRSTTFIFFAKVYEFVIIFISCPWHLCLVCQWQKCLTNDWVTGFSPNLLVSVCFSIDSLMITDCLTAFCSFLKRATVFFLFSNLAMLPLTFLT